MTVAEIKEYIDIKIKYYSEIDQNLFTTIINVKREFEEVKRLLDELELKAKWEETDLWEDGIGDIMKCSNCGHNHLDSMNYCSNCGARMENEQ